MDPIRAFWALQSWNKEMGKNYPFCTTWKSRALAIAINTLEIVLQVIFTDI